MTGASSDSGNVAAGGEKEDLMELSCEELRVRLKLQMQRLEVQNCDMSDLRKLVAPFKVENMQLARSLKKSQQRVQQVFTALRDLFKDPARRGWLESHKDDRPLCTFFTILIKWYKKIKEDDDSTISFYEKVWQYERGDPVGDLPVAPVKHQSEQQDETTSDTVVTEKSRRPDAVGDCVDVGGPLGLRSSPLTSTALYDACRERTENLRLHEEIARLRQENASLLRANASLERDIQGLLVAQPGSSLASSSLQNAKAELTEASRLLSNLTADQLQQRKVREPTRTLAQLAASDERWQRLLDDPDHLFDTEDVIDDMYEMYLSDVLDIMRQQQVTFKQAIDVQAREAAVTADKAATDDCQHASNRLPGVAPPGERHPDEDGVSVSMAAAEKLLSEAPVFTGGAHELRSKTSKELLKELDDIKTELSRLRVAKDEIERSMGPSFQSSLLREETEQSEQCVVRSDSSEPPLIGESS